MSRISIVKVKTLQGRVKLMAEADGLEPEDLVILTVSLEKVIGDPVSYLLSQIEEDRSSCWGMHGLTVCHLETCNFVVSCKSLGYDDAKEVEG